MSAEPFLPKRLTPPALVEAVQQLCWGCPLYANATQAVFGEGRRSARVMLVGEQPGDQEDRAGTPFVGPAGQLLDRALGEAGIDRTETYVTNAVKHFKWKARGKAPDTRQAFLVGAARLSALARRGAGSSIEPEVLIVLGATAAADPSRAEASESRGIEAACTHSELAETVIATIHPSAILRSRDRDEMFSGLVDDLALARR